MSTTFHDCPGPFLRCSVAPSNGPWCFGHVPPNYVILSGITHFISGTETQSPYTPLDEFSKSIPMVIERDIRRPQWALFPKRGTHIGILSPNSARVRTPHARLSSHPDGVHMCGIPQAQPATSHARLHDFTGHTHTTQRGDLPATRERGGGRRANDIWNMEEPTAARGKSGEG